ncbi:unnamed protein product [Callosobruchus maculatus]|uniref:Uncharacterized protein n=1 Tax=Callosobruchus maculatus TaxID=64391 RepID=A0A653DRH1_CALMS|nr:unnamed protein product [Callosobruchus maculatus]
MQSYASLEHSSVSPIWTLQKQEKISTEVLWYMSFTRRLLSAYIEYNC